ncbi:hypothetical protein DFH08DRAFT_716268 [Mycena albidolilacea]|uniref:Uncharacterized protein n=1 Tax=Mycena albidolilacea TaxID=1033008 RepID=A0AAD6ZB74_9AGAR|nr:hypothetical protein DFH08DRAFT_716268 [Mycena albidolilacea]
MRESVGATKKFPKWKFFVCAFGSDISCNKKLSGMCNHVGQHILLALHQKIDHKAQIAVEADPCGLCGLEGCYIQLSESKITSDCDYHYSRMNHKSAKKTSQSSPCANVPIHCPLCHQSTSGNLRTIWKYNTVYHIISEHTGNNEALSELPVQFTIDTFIRRQEEEWMGITADKTHEYR